MRKLNKAKILWILRRKREGMSNNDIAVVQKVSPRWVRHLWSQYRNYGRIVVKRPGRPRTQLALEDIKLILSEHPKNSGAVILESRIEAKHHKHIPHNSIHKVLRMAGYAEGDPRKQKRRRPWVRYERHHSLSLVHTDWHESKITPGKWVIAFEDDASRMILAIDEYDNANTENAIKTLKKAMAFAEPYGGIECILTDHGTQFTVNKPDCKKPTLSDFEKFLRANGIGHIMGRVNHPQTNGKIERFFQTYNRKRAMFKTLEEFITWYNTDRLHMSLKMHYAETPHEAFMRKMEPSVWLGKAKDWFV
jgi:putative transposase